MAAWASSSEPVLNRTYRELARHFGFQIDPTPPRAPRQRLRIHCVALGLSLALWPLGLIHAWVGRRRG